jgi:hypothetical protein
MATNVECTVTLDVQGTNTSRTAPSNATSTVKSGQNSFPATIAKFINASGEFGLTKWYCNTRALGAGANESLDLAGGLTDESGATLTFTGVKLIVIAIETASVNGTNKLTVGNGTNPFNGPISSGGTIDIFYALPLIHPGATGWSVTAATGDNLKISNPGASAINYTILIGGN